jgi:hypothetical protein
LRHKENSESGVVGVFGFGNPFFAFALAESRNASTSLYEYERVKVEVLVK